MERMEAVEVVWNLLENEERAVLATIGAEGPHASLMAFAAVDGGATLVFATLKDTRKYRNLRSDNRGALLIDNRSAQAKMPGEIITATAMGHVQECSLKTRSDYAELLTARHPRLKDFIRDEDCAIMALRIDNYRVVGRFQTGEELAATVGREQLRK